MSNFIKVVFVLPVLCSGFLLNSTGLLSAGGATLTDSHFITVVDMITNEKHDREQLGLSVQELVIELAALKQELQIVMQGKTFGQQQEITDLQYESIKMKQMVQKLKEDISNIRAEYGRMQSELWTCNNLTANLSKEFGIAKHFNELSIPTFGIQMAESESMRIQMAEAESKIRLLVDRSKSDSHLLQLLSVQWNTSMEQINTMLRDSKSQSLQIQILQGNIRDLNITVEGSRTYGPDVNHTLSLLEAKLVDVHNKSLSIVNQTVNDREDIKNQLVLINQTMESAINKLNSRLLDLQVVQTVDSRRFEQVLIIINQTVEGSRAYGRDVNHTLSLLEAKLVDVHNKSLSIVNQTVNDRENIKNQLVIINQTMESAISKLKSELRDLQVVQTVDSRRLEQVLIMINQTVVLNACATNGSFTQGEIIHFPNIKTHNGVTDLKAFQNTGMFTCEVSGYYLVSAYIMSYSMFSSFYIVKNGEEISSVYIKGSDGQPSRYGTGTAIQAVHLNAGDVIYVKTAYQMYIYADLHSCVTVAKL